MTKPRIMTTQVGTLDPFVLTDSGRTHVAALVQMRRKGIPPVTRMDRLLLIIRDGGGFRRGATVLMGSGMPGIPDGTPFIIDRHGVAWMLVFGRDETAWRELPAGSIVGGRPGSPMVGCPTDGGH